MTRLRTISAMLAFSLLSLSGEVTAATGTSDSRLSAPKPKGEQASATPASRPAPPSLQSTSTTRSPTTRSLAQNIARPKPTSAMAADAKARPARASTRLHAPMQDGESEQAFFVRAATEVGKSARDAEGHLTPAGDAALERLARGAALSAIRTLITNGGVRGSRQASNYVDGYRNGYAGNNFNRTGPNAPVRAPLPSGLFEDHAREQDARAVMAQTPDGRKALEHLRRAGSIIRFRQGGGTRYDADNNVMIVDTVGSDDTVKPTTWIAAGIVHEAEHALQHQVQSLPPWLSAKAEQWRLAKEAHLEGNGPPVPMEPPSELLKEQEHYVNRMTWSEAHAMTSEARFRLQAEAKGIDFHNLDDRLIQAYKSGYEGVYRAANVTPPSR